MNITETPPAVQAVQFGEIIPSVRAYLDAQTHAALFRSMAADIEGRAYLSRFPAATSSLPVSVRATYQWLAMRDAETARHLRAAADEIDGQPSLALGEG
ncbi:MAG: hypothetical protein NTX56_04245 [Proteobacteria bacterium]|nr:hypothetical protein [Pseudomonadota bacterium]